MTATKIMRFTIPFEGRKGDHLRKTKSIPGVIEDVDLIREYYGGWCNYHKSWKTVGGDLVVADVRFWQTHANKPPCWSQVSLEFEAYYKPIAKAAQEVERVIPAVRQEIFDIELSGKPGEKLEKSFTDLKGTIREIEIVDRSAAVAESVEVKAVKPDGFRMNAVMGPDATGVPAEEIVYVLATLETE